MADTEATDDKPKSPEEEDEDYMGDLSKFIITEPSQPPKPKKLAPKTLSNSSQPPSKKKPKFQTWQHQKERKQLEEDEQTLENLQSAIPQSNIGFKLLKKMGYTPGKGLGKEGSVGREEPIGLEIRRSRSGIGREDPAKERVKREKDREVWKKKTEEVMLEDFGVRQKMQWKSKRVVINYNKAKAALDQLENREPADLLVLLEKLREEHYYCLFCGCQTGMGAGLTLLPDWTGDDCIVPISSLSASFTVAVQLCTGVEY
uniref:G-patch domain-containing protein n=1 Tax=Chenopodium quinoa TaxID=63459 RepID=A0A803LFV6_CHEQI